MAPSSAATATPRANPWLAWSATITAVKAETPGVRTYDIVLDDAAIAAGFRIQPGQFNMLYVPGIGESAISVSGDPDDTSSLRHTIREAGNVTNALAEMGPGSSIGLRGPFGSAWPVDECSGKDVILVTGGIGMAPLRPVVYSLLKQRGRVGKVTLLMGARTPADVLYPEEWPAWQSQIDVQCTVDRSSPEWQDNVGVVTTLLERLPILRPEQTVLMTCGPDVMMWYTARCALSRGLKPSSIWLSLERNMNCAVGFCGHCQFGPQFICKDGPVVRYDVVAPFLKVKSL